MICQLQGVRPLKLNFDGTVIGQSSSRGLATIDWQRSLIEIVGNVGQQLGYSRIAIQGAINNEWTRKNGMGVINLPLERAINAYDLVAKRLGFQEGTDCNWYKSLR